MQWNKHKLTVCYITFSLSLKACFTDLTQEGVAQGLRHSGVQKGSLVLLPLSLAFSYRYFTCAVFVPFGDVQGINTSKKY